MRAIASSAAMGELASWSGPRLWSMTRCLPMALLRAAHDQVMVIIRYRLDRGPLFASPRVANAKDGRPHSATGNFVHLP